MNIFFLVNGFLKRPKGLKPTNARFFVCVAIVCLFAFPCAAQLPYRLAADFSIKEIQPNGGAALVMGRVFFDKNFRQIIYKISFPETLVWVMTDSLIFTLKGGKVASRKRIPPLLDFSVFALSLSGRLRTFGLAETKKFEMTTNQTNEQGVQIQSWTGKGNLSKQTGTILMQIKDRQLQSLAFLSPKNALVQRISFDTYDLKQTILQLPGRMIEESFLPDNKKNTKITSFKKVIINEKGADNLYNFADLR